MEQRKETYNRSIICHVESVDPSAEARRGPSHYSAPWPAVTYRRLAGKRVKKLLFTLGNASVNALGDCGIIFAQRDGLNTVGRVPRTRRGGRRTPFVFERDSQFRRTRIV